MATAAPTPVQTQFFPLVGGLDVESSQLARNPGLVIGGINYESSALTGYERIGGYERFDGRPRPSDATYKVLQATTTFSGVSVGDTVNGQTSGATGKVIQVRSTSQLVLTRVTGTFVAAENIRVSTTVVGVLQGDAVDVTASDDNVLTALAAADYRADIAAVPGSGPGRGVAVLGGTVYAWRDNAGGTAMAIYKSSGSGWTAVTLFKELAFTAGSGTPPAEGATITKGSVTATVKRVVLQSGTWAGGTAAGRFIVDNVAGGNFSAGAFTAGVTATCSGAETQITLAPGGRLDHVVYNFTASADNERIYGADGVNNGFEFDGTVYVPIRTGMATDTPRHVAAHKNHLFFAFKASVQNSSIGQPYQWSVVTGAAEVAAGQEVTGFMTLPGEVDSAPLMIFGKTRTSVIYGTSSADWKLTTFSSYIGAQRWSIQNIGNPVVLNSQGIVPLVQSSSFGNFDAAPASARVQSYLGGKVATASVVNRKLNRMRIFFSDGYGISITPLGNTLGYMPISYNQKVVRCATEAIINDVNRTFFMSDDGYVYEADVGRSFDGASIEAWIKLAFNHVKSPTMKKRFRKVAIEIKAQSAGSFKLQGEYSLGDIEISPTPITNLSIAGAAGTYDVSNWDQCFYDNAGQSLTNVRIDGVGTNLSLIFSHLSANELPHLFQSVTTTYSPRRLTR